MTSDLSNVTAMVVDNGLFAELGSVLARSYKKVYYYNPCQVRPFPRINPGVIGDGFEGVEVVKDLWHDFDKVELFVFPDIYFGATQDRIAAMGKLVWGSRRGERLEIDRIWTKELMAKWGLPVGPYAILTGMTRLRDYLRSRTDTVWIKIDGLYRGHFETIKCESYDLVKSQLDRQEWELGEYAESVRFIVEDDLPDRIEIGPDTYCVDGVFPDQHYYGIEQKGEAYLGAFSLRKDIPAAVTQFGDAAHDLLRDCRYRGPYSDENRVGKDGVSYMNDVCARHGSPPSEALIEAYMNLAEIIYYGAQGILIQPEPIARWIAVVTLSCSFAEESYVTLEFPKQNRRYVKLRNAGCRNGRFFTIPQESRESTIGRCIGWGHSRKAAQAMATEVALSVKANHIETSVAAFDELNENVDKAMSWIGAFSEGKGNR